MQKKQLITIFTIVFIDLLGFGLILPLIPFYAEAYGATPTIAGLLVASYAAAQLVGSPLLGRLSDHYGRRPVLLASIGGTCLGFILLGVASPLGLFLADLFPEGFLSSDPTVLQNYLILTVLFISRILDGLTGGNISVAQAYIADITTETDRAKGMGLLGAAFGLGFIIGPAMGGGLSIWGYAVPAFAAAGLSALNWIGVFIWLPESLTEKKREELTALSMDFSLKTVSRTLWQPRVGPLLQTRFFYGLAFAMLQTIFPLYAEYQLGLNEQLTGYILAYVGLLVVLVQGVIIRRLTNYYTDRQLIFAAVILMAPSLLGWALAPSLGVLLLVLIPIALAGGTFNTALHSALSKSVYTENVGSTLGFSASLESLTRALSPTIGGFLLQKWGPSAPGIFAAATVALLIPFVWRRLIANPDPPLPQRSRDPLPPVSTP